ncbi:MAG: transcriptional regulator [Rickettsiales bacterium]|nr:MAG: transcriptional regulator [Rickettsiales bacterium]
MNNINDHHKNIQDLCKVLLLLETEEEVLNFLKDLCTPTELFAFAERWQICMSLNDGLSYREVHAQLGASLTTIGRVARFLKNENYKGYVALLKKLKKQTNEGLK